MYKGRRSFPGRRTLEEWLAIPFRQRIPLVWRAPADLLGSFRSCPNKRCRRHRMCCSDQPEVCRKRVWRIKKVVPKTLRWEWARINNLANLPYWAKADQDRPLERP
jgi:hypothetical protein